MAEEYTLKQLIQAAVNRESSKANAEALQAGPTRSVNRLNKVEEQQRRGSDIDARIGHLQAELEYMMKLLMGGKHSGRHKKEEEREQCPRCTYERHEVGQWCPAEVRRCNTCGVRGHFGRSRMCKRKRKAAGMVKEEREETSSRNSESDEEVNRIDRDRGWPGTSTNAKCRSVCHIMKGDIVVDPHIEGTMHRQSEDGYKEPVFKDKVG